MSTIEDGGPAFAAGAYEHNGGGGLAWQDGMSLRDYFAAKAMQSIAAVAGDAIADSMYEKAVAAQAYMLADAMIVARTVRPKS